MQKISLKKNIEHRRRTYSPWIFRDEIEFSNKQLVPGEFVEVQTANDSFYAYGYVNPESQIAVRILTMDSKDWITREGFLVDRFLNAWRSRARLGRKNSFRLIFSEADFLPGFIVDLYRVKLANGLEKQIFAMQVLTAGAERLMSDKSHFFQILVEKAKAEGLTDLDWDQTGVVLRNDVRVREKEGLRVEEPRFLKSFHDFDPQKAKILISHGLSDSIEMSCDLYQGQKTGFFLDQYENIQKIVGLSQKYFPQQKTTEPLKILDLCCYVGHWSAHLAALSKSVPERTIELHLVDVSEDALKRAEENVVAQIKKWELGGRVQVFRHKGDVLNYLEKFEPKSFDLVITDPPGFIKAKKDIENGKSAYIRLNTESIKLVKDAGIFVTCSCSGLLDEESFGEVISRSFLRTGRQGRWVIKGGPSFDHPSIVGFSQSQYLKMFGFILD